MRGLLAAISGSVWPAAMLLAQGISPETTRALTEVSEMGRSTIKPETLPRSLTFEEGDDPTVAAHSVSTHQPLPAARKAAEKAERLAKKKQYPEAIAKYQAAVAIDPLYFEAWNNLALELQGAGRTDEAEQVFRRLMQSDPEHVLVFTNLASLLSGEKRYAEAEVVARQAMKLHSYSFKANYVLGSLLVRQGKWNDEAKTKLTYAQMKYPEAKTLLDHWPEKAGPN
jgi:tetratricopeptide (TPR) repeat protein